MSLEINQIEEKRSQNLMEHPLEYMKCDLRILDIPRAMRANRNTDIKYMKPCEGRCMYLQGLCHEIFHFFFSRLKLGELLF